ncbi:MAG: SDR family oxidoreductase [Planctomycetes bacterium]|nr:SDR family oxidoreductase [Planctomycetota bacterium]
MNEHRDKLWHGVAIITGASSGMGEAIAKKLAPRAKGLVVSARRFDKIKSLAATLGNHVLPIACDVQNKDDVQHLVESTIDTFGQVDLMINNAGIAPMASMTRCRVEDWENTIDTNLKGVLYGIAAVLPQMLQQKTGRIINISSEAGRRVFPGAAVYCATKHAVRVISEGLQMDLSARSLKDGNDIKVTTIAPGYVTTDLPESVTFEPARKGFKKNMQNVEDPMSSEDIADCIWYVLNTPPHVEIGELIVRPVKQNI